MPEYASYAGLKGKYIVHETIGSGGFGKVKRASHVATGEKVAIKIMDKKQLGTDLPRVKLEVEALKELHHEHVCELYEVIEANGKIFLVLEYCSGGELFDYIVEKARLEEKEARAFFRQIVAAVAFIHAKGFAHRDLKPENLLIGEDKILKVIDFGLCAKPKGGIGVALETFCGSPAYAAPELIQEENYFGNQADIWSMGVLLFALLCGYLPFDDENMTVLYQKIQYGKYDCPSWLSLNSRDLLRKMLEVDPKKRIGICELFQHPWVVEGYREPVDWRRCYKKTQLDEDCLNMMSISFGMSKLSLEKELAQWKYDYLTSTYLLLLLKKRKGRPVRVPTHVSSPLKQVSNRSPHWEVGGSLESGLDNVALLNLGSPKKEDETPKKYQKEDKENFALPLPKSAKKNRRTKGDSNKDTAGGTPGRQAKTPADATSNLHPPIEKRRSQSCDRGENRCRTPERNRHLLITPTKAKKVFGSLEKSLDRIRGILTPRKKIDYWLQGPRKIKGRGLYNVSVFPDYRNADQVMAMLKSALECRGIPCKQDGYSLRNKRRDESGKVMLDFELEVCLLIPEELVCVCRKRLKGDAWLYKRVVEEILNVINTKQQ